MSTAISVKAQDMVSCCIARSTDSAGTSHGADEKKKNVSAMHPPPLSTKVSADLSMSVALLSPSAGL